jgi:flagellar hook-associated protein 2
MALSSPGIGSGLDVNGIVSQLVDLERRPVTLLEQTKAKLTTQLSSFGLLNSYLGNLQSVVNQLTSASFWTRNSATSSDTGSVSVNADASAAAGSYSIEVTSIAVAQSQATPATGAGGFADPTNVGGGTINVTVKGTTVPITIAADSSLAAVRDQINSAKAGVTASIIQDGSGPRLVLTASDTGVVNAVTIDGSGTTGQLQTALAGLTTIRPAADAVMRINGLQVSSPSNQLQNVIDGVSLTVSKVTTGPVQVSVASDKAALTKGITDFVAAYNDIVKFLGAQTRYDEATKTAGALQGDSTAVGLLNRLRSMVQQPSSASSVFQRLGDFGLSLQRDGTLKVDDSKLAAALSDRAEAAKAFSSTGNGLALGFKALVDGMLGASGALTSRTESLRERIKRNEREQERLEDRIERVRERLLKQYSALDSNLSRLNALDKYVAQQVTNWNKSRTD